jgi:putative ABC transport system permease protein
MFRVALRMLTGDRIKYLGIVVGLMFASFLITQQISIFIGLMSRTFAVITDITTSDIWVMDPAVKNVDDSRPVSEQQLFRVKSVPGVAWAVPLFKGNIRARLSDGTGFNCIVMGLDDQTLTAGPPVLFKNPDGSEVSMGALRQPDAIIVDAPNAHEKLDDLQVGDVLDLNDNRAKVVGLCDITQGFQGQPLIYTTFSRATTWVPNERKQLTFILAKAKPGEDVEAVCQSITAQTGLAAYTNSEFKAKTLWYYVKSTGIPINFGTTVILGFVVGVAISGMLFYQFTMDNLRYFGTLKAMGASNFLLVRMILLQSSLAGVLGFGLGVGATATFQVVMGHLMPKSQQVMLLLWQTLAITGGAIVLIVVLSSFFAILKVIRLEPAAVFK